MLNTCATAKGKLRQEVDETSVVVLFSTKTYMTFLTFPVPSLNPPAVNQHQSITPFLRVSKVNMLSREVNKIKLRWQDLESPPTDWRLLLAETKDQNILAQVS